MSQRGRIPANQPAGLSTLPPKNIVVFGESGVGKSSLINLIAGRSIAATSSGAKGCTFQHKKYELQVDDTPYAIWDTAGLDEGAYGTIPAEIAEEYLKQLLRALTRANGVHLLVYCIRASRLRKALLSNYNLFYSAICRKKVPIVVVVTGLENYEEEMEDWWAANEAEFAILKMHFDGHACLTTLNVDKVNSPVLKQRCLASRQAVLTLIAGACARDRWETGQDGWMATALADVRGMFRLARHNSAQPTPIVALYDVPDDSSDPIGSTTKHTPFEGGRLVDVGGSPLLVYPIRDHHLRAGSRFKKQISPRGADLLIICMSVQSASSACRARAADLYRSYGGETRPLLVVVRGALSDEEAHTWWNAAHDDDDEKRDREHPPLHHHPTDDPYYDHRHTRSSNSSNNSHGNDVGKLQAIVRALPLPEHVDERQAAVARLRRTIETRALQPVDMTPTGCFRWLTSWKRPAKLSMDVQEDDSLTSSGVWTSWQHARRV